ncbi:response regulator [Sulfurimonas sp.]
MKSKQTVLIVDDVKENVDLLVEILQDHDLVTALDGKTALEVVENEDIDLILLDIMMPILDGFEVCKTLKQNSKTSHIPIIFLSAKNEPLDVQEGFKLGAVDYITKPFNPNELLSRVSTHLQLRSYEKDLEKRVEEELEKNKIKEQMIHQQVKQAALGELLMHIAHQWKQPLASLGSINLLCRTKIEQDIEITPEELLSKIEKSEDLISFMSDTVDTFKDFYKPSFKNENFSITDSVYKVLNISEATLNYDNIKITLSSYEADETFGNENEFTQTIFSIINNARNIFKLRQIIEPELKIKIENQKISISDNAGGVDEDIIDDIFLPFVSTTNSSGLGLYIAKEILEKNSAAISVYNDDDGAVFTIEFLTWLN